MEETRKNHLMNESIMDIKEKKKTVSALILTPHGITLINHGQKILCQNIQVILSSKIGNYEWCFNGDNHLDNRFPETVFILFFRKKGRVLLVEEEADGDHKVLVGGYDEQDDDLVFLIHIQTEKDRALYYYNKHTKTPFLRLCGREDSDVLGELYQGIKVLLDKNIAICKEVTTDETQAKLADWI